MAHTKRTFYAVSATYPIPPKLGETEERFVTEQVSIHLTREIAERVASSYSRLPKQRARVIEFSDWEDNYVKL